MVLLAQTAAVGIAGRRWIVNESFVLKRIRHHKDSRLHDDASPEGSA
jgi:hypothetical protein